MKIVFLFVLIGVNLWNRWLFSSSCC